MQLRRSTPPLPCPLCRQNGNTGGARIGSSRRKCNLCNRFYQQVIRLARQQLAERHAAEYEQLRLRAEVDLYPRVIEEFSQRELLG